MQIGGYQPMAVRPTFSSRSYTTRHSEIPQSLLEKIAKTQKEILNEAGGSTARLVISGTDHHFVQQGKQLHKSPFSWIATGEDALFLIALNKIKADFHTTNQEDNIIDQLKDKWLKQLDVKAIDFKA